MARTEHVGVDAVGQEADHGVDVARGAHELVVVERRVVDAVDDLVSGAVERVEPTVGEAAGDEDAPQRGQCSV